MFITQQTYCKTRINQMLSFKKGILNFQSEVYIYSTCTLKTVLDQHECVFKYDLVIENNVE